MQELEAYIPLDRRQALAKGEPLPNRTQGAALFADVSGFTLLTRTFARELGPKRGTEALLNVVNPVFEALITPLHNYGGSVINFAGDAIICWLDNECRGDATSRAVKTALAMQEAMQAFAKVETPAGQPIALNVKVAIAAGPARRFLVGDPTIRIIDTLAGATLERMAMAEQHTLRGEVIVSRDIAEELSDTLSISTWRAGGQFAVVEKFHRTVQPIPWPLITNPTLLPNNQSWTLPIIREQLRGGTLTLGDLRPVTPLFLQFQGLDFDNDDAAGEKLDAFARWAQRIIHAHGGALLHLIVGDKGAYVCGVFGAPLAHEDDAARALHTALALQALPPTLAYINPPSIGISQGEAWTGICGTPTRHCYTIMGDDINLSARLMDRAKPGQILVSERIAQTPGFALSHVGDQTYKGFDSPLPTYSLRGEEIIEARVFSNTLVGRAKELQQLRTFAQPIFENQRAGVAIIYGEAGIGKSRLAYALQHALENRVTWLTGQSNQMLQGAFAPFTYFLKHYFNQSPTAGDEENCARFEARFKTLLSTLQNQTSAADTHHLMTELMRTKSILGALLGLHWPNTLYEHLDAQGRYQNTLTAITTLVLAESQLRPVVLEIEDGQWLDEASQELLVTLTRQACRYPFLCLITSRYTDDGAPPTFKIAEGTPTLILNLNVLSLGALKQLAEDVLSGPADVELLALVWERSHANPFFAQQLLYHLQEKGHLTQTPEKTWFLKATQQRSTTSDDIEDNFPESQVPTSINTVLIARIDRLEQHVKDTVQAAAVLGREFAVKTLAHMLSTDVLPQIQRAEREQIWMALSELRYLFKHTLLRDAAYEMQLRTKLRKLHHLATQAYEQLYATNPASTTAGRHEHYARLVYHYGQAGDPEQECRYAKAAGEAAAAHFANDEALRFFNRALALTPTDNIQERYELLLAREKIYGLQGKREARANDLATLTKLAQALGAHQQAVVALRQARYAYASNEYGQAIAAAQDAIQQAQSTNDIVLTATGHYWWGWTLYRQGDYPAAGQKFTQALTLAQAAGDAKVAANSHRGLGFVARFQGKHAEARKHLEQSLNIHREIGERRGEASTINNLGTISMEQGDYASARRYYEQALSLYQHIGYQTGTSVSLNNLGEVNRCLGDYGEAAKYCKQALDISREIGNHSTENLALCNLSLIYHNLGDTEAALHHGQPALQNAREIGERGRQGFILTNLGHALAASGQWMDAAAAYRESLSLRRDLGTLNLALETLAGLARVTLAQGQPAQALSHIEDILSHLKASGNFDGTDEPFHIHLTCCRVLEANDDPRLTEVLDQAYHLLQAQAQKIPDEPTRHAYLEHVPYHRDLITLWEART